MKVLRLAVAICTLFVTVFPIVLFCQPTVPYGDNPQAGAYTTLNGVRHYYETYGAGAPLLLIHGNGTATKGWTAQIEFFAKKYRVYSVDCRGRGKSDLGKDTLRFEQLADDMAAFLEKMRLDSVDIIGKSDGAIIALLMGIRHPARIRRIVAWAGNMQPDTTALYPQTLTEMTSARQRAEKMVAVGDTTKNWEVEQQRYRLDEFQPHISAQGLKDVQVPVLVMSADRDVIKLGHTLWIYQQLPRANLCIVPGETHRMPSENPALFNQLVDAFLSKPFVPETARFGH